MKTYDELYSILRSCPPSKINSHVHTHLCDGAADMTVENIAREAEEAGLSLIILVPHFHKRVEDATKSLYEDSNEEILWQLREEINAYEKRSGCVRVLLSTEADILSVSGDLSLYPSPKTAEALDLITPTLNYHPLLPLEAVVVTGIKTVDEYHGSGRFDELAAKVGGRTKVLETAYETMVNAIRRCPYPAMLGHFFCSHTIPNRTHTWFGITDEDRETVWRGIASVLDACEKTGAMLDLTGIHFTDCTAEEQRRKDGFLFDYQRKVMEECDERGIVWCVGSDAHRLIRIPNVDIYRELYGW